MLPSAWPQTAVQVACFVARLCKELYRIKEFVPIISGRLICVGLKGEKRCTDFFLLRIDKGKRVLLQDLERGF